MSILTVRRLLLAVMLLTAVACRSHGTPPSDAGASTDVGAVNTVPPAALPPASAAIMMRMRGAGLPQKPPPPRPPVDPYVQRCLDADYGTDGWAGPHGLAACLSGAPQAAYGDAGAPDAGHKLGAVRPNPVCPAKLVGDWYFSPSGNNANTCVDSGHPCKDPIEVESRWGCGAGPDEWPILTAGTNWHIVGDMAASSAFRLNPTLADASNTGVLTITCDSTQVAGPLTMGTVTPKLWSRAPGVGVTPSLSINFGAPAASYIGLMVVNTDRGNSVAWAKSLMPGADGGPTTVVKMTQPVDPFGDAEIDTWATGDHFTVQQPSKLWLTEMAATCTTYECEQYYPNNGNYPRIDNCWIPTSLLDNSITKVSHTHFHNTRIDSIINADTDYFHNTLITKSPADLIGTIHLSGAISNAGAITSIAGGIPFGGAMRNISEGAFLGNDIIVTGQVIVFGPAVVSIDAAECDNDDGETGPVQWNIIGTVGPVNLHTPRLYGNCDINTQWGGLWTFTETMGVQSLFGPSVSIHALNQAMAIAEDNAHTPVEDYIRPLTPTALTTTFVNGGFSNNALNNTKNGGYFGWIPDQLSTNPSNVIWSPSFGGTGLDAGGLPGQILQGNGLDAGLKYGTPCGPNDVIVMDPTGTVTSCSAPHPDAGQYLQFTIATMASVAGRVVDLEGDLGVTQSGGNITAWADQSGNGNNLSSVGASIPYTSAGATSYMTFTPSTTQKLKAASFSLATPYDVFMVVRPAATGSNNYLSDFGGNTNYTQDFGGTTVGFDGALSLSSGYTTGADHVVEVQVDSTSKLTVDGNAGVSGSSFVTSASGLSVGNYTLSASVSFDGRYYAFVVYDHILTAADRNLVNGLLGAKYSITIPGGNSSVWTPVALSVPIASLAGCGVNNQILQTISGVQTCETVSGDMTLAAGVATLASVGSAGSCGDATHSCQVTFDTKGRETAESQVAITAGCATYACLTGTPTCPAAGTGITITGCPSAPVVALTTPIGLPLTTPNGGTGISSPAAHDLLVTNGGSAMTLLAPNTAGFVLTDNGAGADPSYQALPFSTRQAIGTNVFFGAGGVIVNVAQVTAGGPAASGLVGTITFDLTQTGNTSYNDIAVGIGIAGGCSTPAFFDSRTVTLIPNAGALGGTGHMSASEVFDFGAGNGTNTICALVQSTTSTGHATANLVAQASPH